MISTVPSSGWRNPQLAAWFYIRPPDDGVQDFDFVVQEPNGITLPVLLPVPATLTIGRDRENYWGDNQPLRGVRIHSESNSVEAEFAEDGAIDPFYVRRHSPGITLCHGHGHIVLQEETQSFRWISTLHEAAEGARTSLRFWENPFGSIERETC